MNKTELISAIAERSGESKAASQKMLDAFMEVTSEELKKGGKVSLIGFGTFDVVERKAREGRNPQTNKKITIPAKRIVKFKNGAALKF